MESLNIPGPIPDYLYRFFETQVVIKGHSEKTAYEYALNVSLFMRYLLFRMGAPEDNTDVSSLTMAQMAQVTSDDIMGFLFYQTSQKGNSPSARSNKLSALSAFYEFLCKQNVCTDNPAAKIERPQLASTLPRYLSVEEALQLLDSIQTSQRPYKSRDYCIVTMFLNCGLRLEELRMIDVDDIRPGSNMLVIMGKGHKEREIPMNDAVLGALDDWMVSRNTMKKPEGEKALFITRQGGKRMSRSAIQKMLDRRLLEADLDPNKFSPHKLRHTAATLMYRTGGDIRAIQELLGHSSLSSTQIYTHVNNEQKVALTRNNPLNFPETKNGNQKFSEQEE